MSISGNACAGQPAACSADTQCTAQASDSYTGFAIPDGDKVTATPVGGP